MKKKPSAIGIIDLIAGIILIIVGCIDLPYDWGLIALAAGIGTAIIGILELACKKGIASGLLRMVTGISLLGIGAVCAEGYDWTIISLTAGGAYVLTGFIDLFDKCIALGVLELIAAVVMGILGGLCIEFDWGITAMIIAVSYLIGGILNLTRKKQEGSFD